eukprot:NODE_741_length_2135_cov_10.363320_g707_i0.p1 GENE.NODE_741_length_2135_cov_10.363320_g707_i0~~NODE_741_length_2135_cov_10.363320_g707_i0.p1  ORF type:complete len:374 (-),score=95.96 NODE_741_length_2135_cov_10.363320_g707_i0:84-1205(-)
MATDLETLSTRLADAHAQSRGNDERARQLQQEKQSLEAKLTSTESLRKEQEEWLEQLVVEKMELEQAEKVQRSQLDESAKLVQQLKEEKIEIERQMSMQKDNLAEMQNTVQWLEKEAAAQEKQYEELLDQKKVAEQEIHKQRQSKLNKVELLEALKEEKQDLDDELTQAASELEERDDRIAELQRNLSKVKEELGRERRALELIKQEKEVEHAEMQAAKAQAASYEQMNLELTGEYHKRVCAALQQTKDWKDFIAELRKSGGGTAEQTATMQVQKRALEDNVKGLHQVIQKVLEEREVAARRHAQMATEGLENTVAALTARNAILEKENTVLQEEHANRLVVEQRQMDRMASMSHKIYLLETEVEQLRAKAKT